jgi:hypothetical protein
MKAYKLGFNLIVIFVCSLVLVSSSCKKTVDLPIDHNYPTTIRALNTVDYNNSLTSFFTRNPDIITALSPFGFCSSVYGMDKEYYIPPKNGIISREETISLAKSFIDRNPKQTGISDTSFLEFVYASQYFGYDSNSFWILQTQTQFVDSLEVLNSNISFKITNGKVIECTGNWYPEIYIPAKFDISKEKALQNLIGADCGICGWVGCTSDKVKQSDLSTAQISIVIYPVIVGPVDKPGSNSKTELRIAYKISLPSTYYIFYIDVMDGKLISSECTVVS